MFSSFYFFASLLLFVFQSLHSAVGGHHPSKCPGDEESRRDSQRERIDISQHAKQPGRSHGPLGCQSGKSWNVSYNFSCSHSFWYCFPFLLESIQNLPSYLTFTEKKMHCYTQLGTYVLSGGPLIFLEKKVCILDTFLRESCIYFTFKKTTQKLKKWLKDISTDNMLPPHEFGQIPLQMVT